MFSVSHHSIFSTFCGTHIWAPCQAFLLAYPPLTVLSFHITHFSFPFPFSPITLPKSKTSKPHSWTLQASPPLPPREAAAHHHHHHHHNTIIAALHTPDTTTSWDALEWTKIEVPSQFPSNSRVSSLPLSHLSNSLYFGLLFLIEIPFLFLPIRIFLLFTARFAVRFACQIRFPAWSRTSHSRGASSLCFNCLLYL